MGAALNIKDEETVRLARELAHATRQPVTQVIRQALERELRRGEDEKRIYIEKLPEIAREFRADMPKELRALTSKEWMDAIYDEGDCFAYALAKATGEPLLYKGDDFSATDVAAA